VVRLSVGKGHKARECQGGGMEKTYDLVVIGGGSAGLTAAGFAAKLGATTALVERHRIGGDCTWTGCVPSKTLIRAASVVHEMRTAHRFGLTATDVEVDLRSVMAHVREVVGEVYSGETPEVLEADGIDVYLEKAGFVGPRTLKVGQDILRAKRFVIATGSRPFIPPIEGLDDVAILTSENLWDLEVLPRHLLVVGAGPIGCEMSQAFRRLGSRVTLLASRERVLPRDDPAASAVIGSVFEREGVDVRYEARAARVRRDSDWILANAGEHSVKGDALLIVTGRRPNVEDMGLENAGVAYGLKGVEIDRQLRTSQRHVYAAGDVTGGPQFTHYAGWQGFLAVRNALLPGSSTGISELVPWTTFTDPEVAQIGLTLEQAQASHSDSVVFSEWPMDKVDRAQTERKADGFIKLTHKHDGTVLGATIVSARAGEMIHEWAAAIQHGLKVGDLASMIHVYPTYSTGSMQLAAHSRVEQMLSGMTGRAIRGLVRLVR